MNGNSGARSRGAGRAAQAESRAASRTAGHGDRVAGGRAAFFLPDLNAPSPLGRGNLNGRRGAKGQWTMPPAALSYVKVRLPPLEAAVPVKVGWAPLSAVMVMETVFDSRKSGSWLAQVALEQSR